MIIDIRTWGSVVTDTFPQTGAFTSPFQLDTLAVTPTHTLVSQRIVALIPTAVSGEETQFVSVLPTTVSLPVDSQAILTVDPLRSLMFENVAGVITYRGQQSNPFRNTVMSLVDADAVAAAIGIGQRMHYVLTDADGAALPGIIELRSEDDGLGNPISVQRSIPFASISGASSLLTQYGWAVQAGVGLPDRSVDIGTLQDLERVVKTLINDLITSGLLAP